MRGILAFAMIVAGGFGSSAQIEQEESGKYIPDTYTAVAQGRNGNVTVEVTVNADSTQSVKAASHQETEGIGDQAVEQLPDAIVKAQSTDVDNVSGATITSNATKTSVNDALKQTQGIKTSPAADVVNLST